MGKGVREFVDVLAAALRDVWSAAAATIEHRARLSHQCVHVANCVGRAREDEARGILDSLEALSALAVQEVEVTESLRHVEVYTLRGLLTMLWHGDPEAEHVVLASGGAMGGLLGPADGIYHDLGVRFAAEGIGLVRVGYRKPNYLGACVHDLVAVAGLAARRGACRFVTMGHSFGGAVAVRAGIVLGDNTAGTKAVNLYRSTPPTGTKGLQDISTKKKDSQ